MTHKSIMASKYELYLASEKELLVEMKKQTPTPARSYVYKNQVTHAILRPRPGSNPFLLHHFSINMQSRRDCLTENKKKHSNLKIGAILGKL
jgi:hypothetical protein